ncbi:MAG: HAMP domain-containing sensor histidine kinase [Bacteroidota bacterium]
MISPDQGKTSDRDYFAPYFGQKSPPTLPQTVFAEEGLDYRSWLGKQFLRVGEHECQLQAPMHWQMPGRSSAGFYNFLFNQKFVVLVGWGHLEASWFHKITQVFQNILQASGREKLDLIIDLRQADSLHAGLRKKIVKLEGQFSKRAPRRIYLLSGTLKEMFGVYRQSFPEKSLDAQLMSSLREAMDFLLAGKPAVIPTQNMSSQPQPQDSPVPSLQELWETVLEQERKVENLKRLQTQRIQQISSFLGKLLWEGDQMPEHPEIWEKDSFHQVFSVMRLMAEEHIALQRQKDMGLNSQQKKWEKEKKELEDKILEYETRQQDLDFLLSLTSHDLKSPINNLKALLEIKEEENQEKDEILDMARDSASRLNEYVNTMGDYSAAKRTDLSFEKVDISALLREIFEILHQDFPDMDWWPEIKFEGKHPFVTDRESLRIILHSLCELGFHYVKTGQKMKVELYVLIEEYRIYIEGRNNSQGFSDSERERLFRPRFLLGGNNNGHGMGLYFVQETLHRLGGKLHLESNRNEGMFFSVLLPNHYFDKPGRNSDVSEE